ncbi:MAG: nucleotidyltransferase family protein [Nitrospirota bacterium]|nr:nucleotidyltransferase family protein [Nitrospirota bacterium]
MDKLTTINLLKTNLNYIQVHFGVNKLLLFGSVVHGTAKEGSDVDILVDFSGQPDFDRFMDLKFFLEDLLKTKVDLVTRDALRQGMRPSIEREALNVA